MVFQTGSSSHGDEGHHLLCRGGCGYYDAVKCQKEGLICINMPLLPKAFHLSPTLGAKSVTQWGIIPLPPGILGQYQPLVLGLVSWVQAWAYHEQGVI